MTNPTPDRLSRLENIVEQSLGSGLDLGSLKRIEVIANTLSKGEGSLGQIVLRAMQLDFGLNNSDQVAAMEHVLAYSEADLDPSSTRLRICARKDRESGSFHKVTHLLDLPSAPVSPKDYLLNGGAALPSDPIVKKGAVFSGESNLIAPYELVLSPIVSDRSGEGSLEQIGSRVSAIFDGVHFPAAITICSVDSHRENAGLIERIVRDFIEIEIESGAMLMSKTLEDLFADRLTRPDSVTISRVQPRDGRRITLEELAALEVVAGSTRFGFSPVLILWPDERSCEIQGTFGKEFEAASIAAFPGVVSFDLHIDYRNNGLHRDLTGAARGSRVLSGTLTCL